MKGGLPHTWAVFVALHLGMIDLTGKDVGVQELIAMQENGPKNLGFFGTRNMGFLHQNLIEVLSYAMVLTVQTPPFPLFQRLHYKGAGCTAEDKTQGKIQCPQSHQKILPG